MDNQIFNNVQMLEWLKYYADTTIIDLGKVKILDITRKNKNLIPAVESHKDVLVFTEAGHEDIFYRMWEAGLGECDVWYNVGDKPEGEILHSQVKDMIDRGINASAAMLIHNPNAVSTIKVGMANSSFSKGSVHYVGSEIRSIILNKMHVDAADDLCIIGGESIAIEAGLLASEGHITAVEYNENDRNTLIENIDRFAINNISIIDRVDDNTMKDQPVPSMTMLVASASTEKELTCLLKLNPKMEVVIYTLDFRSAATLPDMLSELGMKEVEVIQVSVNKLSSKNTFTTEPAPWIISARG